MDSDIDYMITITKSNLYLLEQLKLYKNQKQKLFEPINECSFSENDDESSSSENDDESSFSDSSFSDSSFSDSEETLVEETKVEEIKEEYIEKLLVGGPIKEEVKEIEVEKTEVEKTEVEKESDKEVVKPINDKELLENSGLNWGTESDFTISFGDINDDNLILNKSKTKIDNIFENHHSNVSSRFVNNNLNVYNIHDMIDGNKDSNYIDINTEVIFKEDKPFVPIDLQELEHKLAEEDKEIYDKKQKFCKLV
jgi:hypothetical protein